MENSTLVKKTCYRTIMTELEHRRLTRWRVSTFWVMLIGYIGYYLCRANMSAAFPLLSQTFGFTNSELGLIALYSEFAYAVGKFINGPWADHLGGKKTFLLGMAGGIVFNLVFSQMHSLFGFILIWCFCRFFLSMGWGGIVKTIGSWYPPEKNGTIMGFISINFQFGGVVATLFAGALIAHGVGWQGVFIAPAAVTLLIWIWSYFAAKEKPQDVIASVPPFESRSHLKFSEAGQPTSVRKIILGLFQYSPFRQILLFSFLTTLLRSIFFFWTPKLLVDIGMQTSTAVFGSAIFPFLGCLGTVLLGWFTDRYAKNGDRAQMMWILLIGLVASLLGISYFMGDPAIHQQGIILLLGLAGFFLLGPYSMSAGCLTLDIAGAEGAGSAAGFIDGVGYIGGALATWLTGLLSDQVGWRQVFLILSGCAVAATISAFALSRSLRHAQRTRKPVSI